MLHSRTARTSRGENKFGIHVSPRNRLKSASFDHRTLPIKLSFQVFLVHCSYLKANTAFVMSGVSSTFMVILQLNIQTNTAHIAVKRSISMNSAMQKNVNDPEKGEKALQAFTYLHFMYNLGFSFFFEIPFYLFSRSLTCKSHIFHNDMGYHQFL